MTQVAVGSAIVIYDSSIADNNIPGIETEAGKNGLYTIILQTTDTDTHMEILKIIKEKDYTGNTLFIFNAEQDLDIMEQVRTSGYYEVYFAVPTNDIAAYDIMEICAYCGEGTNVVNTINNWNYKEGFRSTLIFPPCHA